MDILLEGQLFLTLKIDLFLDDRKWHGGTGAAIWRADGVRAADSPVRRQRDGRTQNQHPAGGLPGALGKTRTANGDTQ